MNVRDVLLAVRRRLTGEKRGSFAMKGSNWFDSQSSAEWSEVVRLLDGEHRRLRDAIEALSDALFADEKRVYLIYGIAAHDLYHAGQIQLLKRLQR